MLDDVPRDATDLLVGWVITGCVVERTWLAVDFAGGHALRLASDPADRPRFAGDGRPRALAPDDDLRTAVVLSRTTEIWV